MQLNATGAAIEISFTINKKGRHKEQNCFHAGDVRERCLNIVP